MALLFPSLQIPVGNGPPSDSLFITAPPDGQFYLDQVNLNLYVRLKGSWVNTTGGGTAISPATTVTGPDTAGHVAVVGTGTFYARNDHDHGLPAGGAPGNSAVGDLASTGTATTYSLADHRHGRENFATGASTNSAVGDSAGDGTSASSARADHRHGREAFGSPGNSAVGDAAAAGSATTVAHSDHVHGRETFGAVAALAESSTNGTLANVSHSDHNHGGLGHPLALTGATAATRYVGGTASGAPTTGTFATGDFVIDQTGKVFVCTAAGTPGTWAQVGATPAGTLLAIVSYNPGTEASYATSSTSLVDVDATNLVVTFTAPASGNVVVELEGPTWIIGAANDEWWGLRESTATVGNPALVVGAGTTSATTSRRTTATFYVTGISAGSHSYKWAWAVDGASLTAHLLAGGTALSTSGVGPALMKVFSA